jgi:hypothetical protein
LTPTDQVIRRRESDDNCSQRDPNGGWEGSYAASVVQRQAGPATAAPGVFASGTTALVIHTPITLIRRDVRLSLAAYLPCQPQTRPAAIGHYCQNKSKFAHQEIVAALAIKPPKNVPIGPLNRRLTTTYIL